MVSLKGAVEKQQQIRKMQYNITDTGFCQLLRPIGKNKPFTLYDQVEYNVLSYRSGKWTAKLHQVLDILYNEKINIINVKGLEFRNDRLKDYIKYISEFQFSGLRYGHLIKGPIIGFDGETVIMRFKREKNTRIPITLYSLRYDSQFLYRHFFSQHWQGRVGIYKIKVLIDYLGLRWAKGEAENLIYDYINELQSAKLIKICPESSKKHLNIMKIQ